MRKGGYRRAELVWPGKYGEAGALQTGPSPELQLVTRAQFAAVREKSSAQESWRNQLIWGDNLLVMDTLLKEYAGTIDLMYIDPPFATGTSFFLASEEPAYEDTWGQGLSNYLSMLWPRLQRMRRLLSPTGSIYVHIGWEVSAHVQLLMNEIFGAGCLQNIIVYNYGKFHHAKTRWKRDFDVLLFYSKDPHRWTFNHDAVLDAYHERTELRFDRCDANGRRYKIVKGRRVYRQAGVTPSSVWRLSNLQLNAAEAVGYPTQKTEELLTKILAASSNPDALVADFFCGSGTTLAAAEKLGRRWIGCDLGQAAIQVTQKRLLAIPDRHAFEVREVGAKPVAVVEKERTHECNR